MDEQSTQDAAVRRRRRLLPAAAVLTCTAVAVVLTRGLGTAAAPVVAARAQEPDAVAGAPLADLLPTDGEWGTGWVRDDRAAWQQIADGPGLLHPCGARYPSDAQRTEVVRRNIQQDESEVPAGSAMTFEVARYAPGQAQQALAERAAALQGCPNYTTAFAGRADTPVDVGLLAAPAGGDGAAAHLAVTADTSVGRQAVEYTYLVAQQGDVLLSALVGNGNGSGPDLDTFAQGYFLTARQKLAGLPHPSPEQQHADTPGTVTPGTDTPGTAADGPAAGTV